MEITLKKAKEAAETLARMDNRTYPAKMSYAFGVNRELCVREAKRLEEERIKLCKEHADKDEDGKPIVEQGTYKMSREETEACNKEYAELLETVVDLPLRTVPLELAERCEQINKYDALTAGEMRVLSFMFTE